MLIYLFIIFIVLFPKGGFTYIGIPITWGYLIISFYSLFFLFWKSIFNKFKYKDLILIIMLLPYQFLFTLSIFYLDGSNSFDYVSGFVNFVVFPYVFFIVIKESIITFKIDRFLKFLYLCLVLCSTYGVIAFIYTNITGNFIEIRGVNIPFGEYTPLIEKSNDKFGLYKLVSSYNNGNIYGICMLMFYPIFKHLNKNKLALFIFQLSLVLTLSRTIWFGIIFIELALILYEDRKYIFPKIIGLILVVLCIFLTMLYMEWGFDYIFDSDLGGRASQLNLLVNAHFFDIKHFDGILEIIYVSIIYTFGYFGLILFIIYLLAPVTYSLIFSPGKDKLIYGLSISIICYMLCSISDGAMLLIPVFPIYLLVSTILIISSDRTNSRQ
jgi:hypothetical protein